MSQKNKRFYPFSLETGENDGSQNNLKSFKLNPKENSFFSFTPEVANITINLEASSKVSKNKVSPVKGSTTDRADSSNIVSQKITYLKGIIFEVFL